MTELTSKFGPLPDNHVPDMLDHELALVFCGTALGQKSAQKRAYYANPGNLFWRTLHEVGFTPRRFLPEDYLQLKTLGIGLTDMCKTAYGNDAQLPQQTPDRRVALAEKIRRYQPQILAFTSKAAAAEFLETKTGALAYGMQPQHLGATRFYVLPSPSGSGRRYWTIEPWRELAAIYQRLR